MKNRIKRARKHGEEAQIELWVIRKAAKISLQSI